MSTKALNAILTVLSVLFVAAAIACGIEQHRSWQEAHKNVGISQAVIDAEVAEAMKNGTLQELPPGKKLEGFAIAGVNSTIVYLVRPMRPGETPEVYQLNAYDERVTPCVVREHALGEKK